jgi:dolichol-phosphate mannosyltransferase
VVIPTYNEAETICDLLPQVTAHADVLVADDRSPDGTANVVRALGLSGVHVLERKGPRSFARSYIDGFREAIQAGYPMIGQMDADGSHPVASLPALAAQAESRFDVVLGSRYVPGGRTPGWAAYRRLLSRGGGVYVRATLRLPVADPTSGYRVWRADTLGQVLDLAPEVKGYAFQIATAYIAYRLGFSIGEVPITFQDRRAGQSKMGLPIVLEALRSVPRLRGIASVTAEPSASSGLSR